MDDTSYRRLQNELLANPRKGDVMSGCGGLRKLRCGAPARGKGKRGGCRIVYLIVPEVSRLYFLAIYGKNERDELATEEKHVLTELATRLRIEAGKARAGRRGPVG